MQNADDNTRKVLMESVRRLMHPQEMGEAFKFLAIAPKDTDYVPPGFSPITCHNEQKSKQYRLLCFWTEYMVETIWFNGIRYSISCEKLQDIFELKRFITILNILFWRYNSGYFGAVLHILYNTATLLLKFKRNNDPPKLMALFHHSLILHLFLHLFIYIYFFFYRIRPFFMQ